MCIFGNALLADVPQPGSIVISSVVPGLGIVEWRLSNGVRVFVKPTQFKSDEILMAASREGGTWVAPNADFLSASLSAQVVGASGLGNFNRVELGKKLAGKAVGVAPSITETTENISGQSSPSDLETLFQLTYLFFTHPRLDTTAFATIQNNTLALLADRGQNPDEVFRDTIQVTMSQHDFRARPLTPAVFREVSGERALAFFKSRFSDATGFTFVFVGNIDTTTFKPLVERYLASLPVSPRNDSVKFTRSPPPRGVIERIVHKGTEPKASTVIDFTGSCVFSPQTRFALRALTEVLQLRLTQTLREKLGGTYSPRVGGACSRIPRQEYGVSIQFGSSPENVELLSRATMALVDTLKRIGPTAVDIEKVREQLVRGREVELKQNAYWMVNILGRDQAGEDFAGLLTLYDDMIRNLTPQQVRDAARKYLDVKNYARFVLRPEGK